MQSSNIHKRFIKLFEKLAQKYNRFQVWSDFIVMSACAISNACDKNYFDERESMYMNCVSRYSREDVELFPEMLMLVIIAFQDNPEQDFLGDIFSELRLNNEFQGQFFTPYNIAKLMADINADAVINDLKEKETVSVSDCCCGAGCLLIAFANSAKKAGVNFQKRLIFVAQDIDMIAALMCYIQLSVLGCKGFVKIGNSLTDPVTTNVIPDETIWFTPMYKIKNMLTFMELFDVVKENNEVSITDASA